METNHDAIQMRSQMLIQSRLVTKSMPLIHTTVRIYSSCKAVSTDVYWKSAFLGSISIFFKLKQKRVPIIVNINKPCLIRKGRTLSKSVDIAPPQSNRPCRPYTATPTAEPQQLATAVQQDSTSSGLRWLGQSLQIDIKFKICTSK